MIGKIYNSFQSLNIDSVLDFAATLRFHFCPTTFVAFEPFLPFLFNYKFESVKHPYTFS